ncbi:50S ribosomal protein L14 [Candidatus Cytomitobacter indipagum]|uniref:Large ribosomal subunit protein uL14 n=1 Tax=Candidatus Cytomitobacter indipagum TaxID=2601575 RepID=A0A5C0UEU3_9PROT|nr:50S ribosomal protein L14 [Candidatus Cytomitobacter indipagum]QEK38237.1 50S ribosomal protein L14 [Candidatus Cytomitobacter indipagum]
MIYKGTVLNVADNSGAKKVRCFNMGSLQGGAEVGMIIKISVIDAEPNAKVKSGDVYNAVIVRTKGIINRKNGVSLKYSDNAAVLINEKNEMIGTRVLGCVARESGSVNAKITSKALKVY